MIEEALKWAQEQALRETAVFEEAISRITWSEEEEQL